MRYRQRRRKMRPNSPDVILLMLGNLKGAGHEVSKLPEELVVGLLLEPEDLDDEY
jgi:hypothetical protein